MKRRIRACLGAEQAGVDERVAPGDQLVLSHLRQDAVRGELVESGGLELLRLRSSKDTGDHALTEPLAASRDAREHLASDDGPGFVQQQRLAASDVSRIGGDLAPPLLGSFTRG